MSLRHAVEQAVRDQLDASPDTAIVGEYLLIAATHGFDHDGDQTTEVIVIPDGTPCRTLGLVHTARLMLERDVLEE